MISTLARRCKSRQMSKDELFLRSSGYAGRCAEGLWPSGKLVLLILGYAQIIGGAEPRIHCDPERKRRALPHIRRQSRQLYAACDSQKSNLIASCTCRGVANVVVPDAGDPNVRGVPKALKADGKLNVPAAPPE